MFKEQVIQEDNILKIIISIEKRVYAIEEKLIFTGDHRQFIPKDLIDKTKLVSAPSKKISNMNKQKYTNTGTWVYEIEKPKPPARKRQPRKQKTSTTPSKSGTIKKTTKKEV